jgi:hypothetical protein
MMLFGLLSRRWRKATVPPRPVRLGLEALEARDVPSTLITSVQYGTGTTIVLSGHFGNTSTPAGQVVNIWGKANGSSVTDINGNFSITLVASGLGDVYAQVDDSNVADAVLVDSAPVIDKFTATEGSNDMWVFTGHVIDMNPQNLTINLGGQPVSLAGKTVTVDASGNFSIAIQLNGTESDNGTATAQAVDAWGVTSNIAMTLITQMGT